MLPIIFFFIWYRLGPGKGGSEDEYSREELLLARENTKGCAVPDCLNNIVLKDAEEVTPSSSSRQAPKPRPKRGDKTRVSTGSLSKGDRTTSGGDFSLGEFDDLAPVGESAADAGAWLDAAAVEKAVDVPLFNKLERQNFESLLNFVAFGHKDRQQRVFLPSEGKPPPPPKKPTLPNLGPDEDLPETSKANTDAQTVLKAAVDARTKIGLKCTHVASDLHQKLSESQVSISETTFTLMVEACINGGDLKGASGFLMKMESNGLCPDSDLLDKVMDLYSESRATEASEAPAAAPSSDAITSLSNSLRNVSTPPKSNAFSGGWGDLNDEDQ